MDGRFRRPFDHASGSSLFAIATWRARSLSRGASGLLAAGAVLVVLALLGIGIAEWPSPVTMIPVVAAIVAFPAGWIALGISALRITGPTPIALDGASL